MHHLVASFLGHWLSPPHLLLAPAIALGQPLEARHLPGRSTAHRPSSGLTDTSINDHAITGPSQAVTPLFPRNLETKPEIEVDPQEPRRLSRRRWLRRETEHRSSWTQPESSPGGTAEEKNGWLGDIPLDLGTYSLLSCQPEKYLPSLLSNCSSHQWSRKIGVQNCYGTK